jgi:hypothetical protein
MVINDKPAIGKLISQLSFGFFVTSFLIALIDSIYFGSIRVTVAGEPFRWLEIGTWTSLLGNIGKLSFSGSLDVTPLNNLRYGYYGTT